MNRIYKLKFNRVLNQLIAVSELADNTEVKATCGTLTESDLIHLGFAQLADDVNQIQVETISTDELQNDSILKDSLIRASALISALGLGAGVVASASALTNPTVVKGNVDVVKDGSVTTITNSPSSIINWASFNIGKDEIVKFIQQSANSAVLNRVLGKQASEILGSLQSNGRVFLINPNGILFGKSATVNVAELVASTLDITNEDFTAGRYVFNQEKDTTIASVLNQGMIQVNDDGSLALIGGNVLNNGVLQARNGSIYLLAGKSITIADLDNPLISYKVAASNRAVNLGQIISKRVNMLGAKVAHGATSAFSYADIFTQANTTENTKLDIKITATGEVELFAGSTADQFQTNQQSNAEVVGEKQGLVVSNATIAVNGNGEQAGKVRLLGDYVATEANSAIYAAGGTVFVGGDTQGKGTTKLAQVTRQQQTSVINVSNQGNAGTAIVWGNYLYADGRIEAKSVTGKGGFVETSGKGLRLAETLVISTESNKGRAYYGTWLIDPTNIYVYHEDSQKASGFDTPESPEPDYGVAYKNSTDNNTLYVKDKTIQDKLNSTNVNLTATSNVTFMDKVDITTTKLATSGNLIVNASNITANNSTFRILGVNFTATNNITITESVFDVGSGIFNSANTTVTNSTFSSLPKNLEFNSTKAISFENTTVSSQGNLFVNASETLTVNNSTLQSVLNNTNIFGKDANFSNATISAKNNITVLGTTLNFSNGTSVRKELNTSDTEDRSIIIGNVSTTSLTTNKSSFSTEGSSNSDIYFNATSVSLTNDTYVVSGRDINISTPVTASGKVELDKTTAKATGGKIDIKSYVINLSGTSSLTAQTSFEANATNSVNLKGVTVKAGTNATITAKDNVNSTKGKNKVEGANVTINSTDASVELTNTHLTATSALEVLANTGVYIRAGSILNGNSKVDITSKDQTIDLTSTNISSSNGDVKILAKGKITSENANISGNNISVNSTGDTAKLDLTNTSFIASNDLSFDTKTWLNLKGVKAEASNINATSTIKGVNLKTVGEGEPDAEEKVATTLTARAGNVTIVSVVNTTLWNATIISATGNVTLKSSERRVIVDGSNITAGGTAKFDSYKVVTLNNTNVSGASVEVLASVDRVMLKGSTVESTAEEGAVKFEGKSYIDLNNSTVKAKNKVDFKSNEEFVQTQNSTVSVGGALTVTSNKYSSFSNSTISGSSVSVTSKTKQISFVNTTIGAENTQTIDINSSTFTSITNSTLSSIGDITINATTKNVGISNTTIESSEGRFTLISPEEPLLANSTINVGSFELKAAGGPIKVDNTTITATKEDVESIILASQIVNITNGSKVSTLGDLKVTSNLGKFEVNNSSVSSGKGALTVSSPKVITLNNASISGASVSLTSNDEGITFTNNSTLTTTAGTVTLLAKDNILLETGSAVHGDQGVSIESQNGTVSLGAVNVSANSGTTSLKAKEEVTLIGSNVSGGAVVLNSTNASIATSGNATLHATADKVTVKAETEVTIGNGTRVQSANGVEVRSLNSTVTVVGSNIESTAGAVTLDAKENVTLKNSNISGGSIQVTSANSTVILTANTSLASTGGTTVLKAKESVSLEAGSKVSSTQGITLYSENSTVSVQGSEVVATSGTTNLTAKEEVALISVKLAGGDVVINSANATITTTENTSISASTGAVSAKADKDITLSNSTVVNASANIDITSTNSTANVLGTNLASTSGTVSVGAKENVAISNSNISGNDINLNTANGSLTATNVKVEGKNSITLSSKEEITLDNTTAVGGNIIATTSNASISTVNGTSLDAKTGFLNANAAKDIALGNGTKLSAGKDSSLDAKVNVTVEGTNITSGGTTSIVAKENVTVTNSNVSGASVSLSATNTLNVANSSVNAHDGGVTLLGVKETVLGNGTIVTATKDINVSSAQGNVSITGSNLTARGNVDITAKENITLSNSNISGRNITVASVNVDSKDTILTSSKTSTISATKLLNIDHNKIEARTIEIQVGEGPAKISNTEGSAKYIHLPDESILTEDNNVWTFTKDEAVDLPDLDEGRLIDELTDIASAIGLGNEADLTLPEDNPERDLTEADFAKFAESEASSNRIRRSAPEANGSLVIEPESEDSAPEATNASFSVGSLGSCAATLGALYDKYGVSAADRENQSFADNAKKYNMSDADTSSQAGSCAN